MATKNRLELTWIGKEDRPRLEPRILLEDRERGHHALGAGGVHDNRLIFGDNLLALKALEQEFTGKVKCIFIDPPYNTGSAFTHYDDGVEHSLWLTMMRDRLQQLRVLLRDDGSIWITIDDNEAHYLKVLCDEIFGRQAFVANVVWQKAYTSNQTAKNISNTHDHVLVYCKDPMSFSIGTVPRTDEQKAKFSNPDSDPRGAWKAENLSAGKYYSAGQFEIVGPTKLRFLPPKGRFWRCNESQYQRWVADRRITFGLGGTGRPMLKKFLSEMDDGLTPNTWWTHDEVGSNKEASLGLKAMFAASDDVFQTPKPEKLAQRILTLATEAGDLVLDSFAGSGTTGAVAHKMERRWIMVELREHCHTHIIPRMQMVIDGQDSGGVTEATGWKGGGGFRYFRLATSLLEKDAWGQWVVSKQYNPAMLAEAVCKHEGFRYEPSQEVYWQHGRSTERDYLYVTTQTLTHEQLTVLSHDVGPERSLLVCCSAFRAGRDEFANVTLKKIPQAVLHRCEWGKDDYSLGITDRPGDADGHGAAPAEAAPKSKVRGKASPTVSSTLPLFDRPAPAPEAKPIPAGRTGKKKS